MHAVSSRCRETKRGIALAPEILPAKRTGQVCGRRSLGHQYGSDFQRFELRRLHDGAPEVILNDQHLRPRMREKLNMLTRNQLVVERNQHTAAIENRVGRNQPL